VSSDGPAATIRAAVDADAPDLERVYLASDAGQPPDAPTAPPGTQEPYFRFLIARGRVVVAEADGRTLGFGASVDTGRARHLADLFVHPDVQGGGLGRRLLEDAFQDDWPRTTMASDDPRAMPLYLRVGMAPHWPGLYLAGDPTRLPAVADGLRVDEATFDEVAELETRWIGVDRRPDLTYWSSLPDVHAVVVHRGSVAVGTGLSRRRLWGPGRYMHQAVAAPDLDPGPVLLAMLTDGLAGSDVGGACVPGPSPIVRPLLAAGFRIRDRDTFMASDPRLVHADRELLDTGVL